MKKPKYKIVRIYEDTYKKVLKEMKKTQHKFITQIKLMVDKHER